MRERRRAIGREIEAGPEDPKASDCVPTESAFGEAHVGILPFRADPLLGATRYLRRLELGTGGGAAGVRRADVHRAASAAPLRHVEIGRAAVRERVCKSV